MFGDERCPMLGRSSLLTALTTTFHWTDESQVINSVVYHSPSFPVPIREPVQLLPLPLSTWNYRKLSGHRLFFEESPTLVVSTIEVYENMETQRKACPCSSTPLLLSLANKFSGLRTVGDFNGCGRVRVLTLHPLWRPVTLSVCLNCLRYRPLLNNMPGYRNGLVATTNGIGERPKRSLHGWEISGRCVYCIIPPTTYR